MTICCARFVVTLALVIGVGTTANGQEPPTDFARLQALVKPGDTLVVTDRAGRLFKSKVADVPVELLVGSTGVSALDVDEIALERTDSVWNGALIGLAVAGTPWLIVCAANDWCYYNEYGAENLLRKTALTTAAIGAGIGALIDLSIRQRETIYRAPAGRALTLSVSPTVSASGTSVRLSVTF